MTSLRGPWPSVRDSRRGARAFVAEFRHRTPPWPGPKLRDNRVLWQLTCRTSFLRAFFVVVAVVAFAFTPIFIVFLKPLSWWSAAFRKQPIVSIGERDTSRVYPIDAEEQSGPL